MLPRCASLAGDNGSWARGGGKEPAQARDNSLSVHPQQQSAHGSIGKSEARTTPGRVWPSGAGTDAEVTVTKRASGLGLELTREARS